MFLAVDNKHLANEYKRHIMWMAVVTVVVVAHALYGIYKRKSGYLVPFLVYKLVILIFLTIMLGFAPAIVDELKGEWKSVFSSENEADALPSVIITILIMIGVEAYALLILFSHYTNLRHEAFQSVNTPNVGFTSASPEMEGAVSYPNTFASDMPKKQPPPPYAV
ncbi:hypothetical protein V9T40_014858 [Parthenolecanium corni]|uniref:Uncharacterized protein n=1 Tax=Parthenolecanium corni TaxID=536013 RepID=A0AAN9THA2_9HEMI